MARSINEINITDFVNTEQLRQVPRYTFSLEIKYIDDQGISRVYGPTTHSFPEDIASMPLEIRRAFAEKMITAIIMVTLGIQPWEAYL